MTDEGPSGEQAREPSSAPANDSWPQDFAAAMPFAVRLGIRMECATAAETVGSLPWADDLCTAGGVLHGGALMSLADAVGAVCAVLNLPEGATTTTAESKTNFLRAVRSGAARATARPLQAGRTLIVVQTDVRDERDRLVAQTTQTQLVLPAPQDGG